MGSRAPASLACSAQPTCPSSLGSVTEPLVPHCIAFPRVSALRSASSSPLKGLQGRPARGAWQHPPSHGSGEAARRGKRKRVTADHYFNGAHSVLNFERCP